MNIKLNNILTGAVGTIWSQLPWPSLWYTVKGLFLGVVALEQFLLSEGQLYVEAGNGSKSGTGLEPALELPWWKRASSVWPNYKLLSDFLSQQIQYSPHAFLFDLLFVGFWTAFPQN